MTEEAKADDVKALSPHNNAIYEAGKALVVESITVSREFCKFMITLTTSAIPIHLGLLKFVLPEHYVLSLRQGVFASIPAIIFLFSTIIFTIAYYPQAGELSLDLPDEIEKERIKTLLIRKKITLFGFVFFCIATASMIFCIVYYLTTLNHS